jgi:hypothetical protein
MPISKNSLGLSAILIAMAEGFVGCSLFFWIVIPATLRQQTNYWNVSLLQNDDFRSKSRHAKNFTAGI